MASSSQQYAEEKVTGDRSLHFLVKSLLPSGSFHFNLSLLNSDFVLKLERGPGLELRTRNEMGHCSGSSSSPVSGHLEAHVSQVYLPALSFPPGARSFLSGTVCPTRKPGGGDQVQRVSPIRHQWGHSLIMQQLLGNWNFKGMCAQGQWDAQKPTC